MRNIKYILVLFLIPLSETVFAQDANFTQFYSAPLMQNPALTGQLYSGYTAGLHYREQWSSVATPFKSSSFYFDAPIPSKKRNRNFLSAGLFVISDKAGKSDSKLLSASGSISYSILLNKGNSLVSGMQIGYNQRSINFDNLAWDSQYNGVSYDPSLPTNESFGKTKSGFIDASGGLLWKHAKNIKYELGYAVHHYFQKQTFLENGKGQEFIRHNFHGKFVQKIDRFDIELYAQSQFQGGAKEIIIAVIGGYRYGLDSRFTTHLSSSSIKAGVIYRVGDAISPVIGYEFQRFIQANISYDINISRLNAVSNYRGGWEISIQYRGLFNDNRIKLK